LIKVKSNSSSLAFVRDLVMTLDDFSVLLVGWIDGKFVVFFSDESQVALATGHLTLVSLKVVIIDQKI